MKICLLHYSAPPVVGGVESVLAQHARLMDEAGHSVKIVAGRGDEWTRSIPLEQLPLMDSRHPDILAAKAELDRGRVPPNFEFLVRKLTASLRVALRGGDVAIAHNICSLHKNLALTAALHLLYTEPAFPRLILWHHDLAWTTARYRSELYAGYPWNLLRTAWPKVRHVVVSALRRRELADLLGLAPQVITTVPNGIEITRLLKLEKQTQAFIKQLKLGETEPLLLLPVRLTPRKNIELALRVLAELRRELPWAALVVTGPPGPHNPANAAYFARLKVLRAELGLAEAAHFLAEINADYLPDEVVADFFRLADALILPSSEEGFGIPLIEAALNHLPVFCTDISPLRDLGGNEVSYFSPAAEPERVADMILSRLQTDPVYRFAVRVRRQFTWGHIYQAQIEPLLQEGQAG